MKIQTWLAIKKTSNWRTTVRTTKSQPFLGSNEIAFKLNLDLPDSLFTKPQLEASISVPESAASATVIEAETIDNVAEAIKTATGLDVRVWFEEIPLQD